MSGVSFKDLPQNLQQKLRPYMTLAKNVDEAISMAKANGNWTPKDDKQFSALNGGKAWGDFDAFTAKKQQEKDDLMALYNKNQKLIATSIKRDFQAHPEKYAPKICTLENGFYVTYKRDPETGRESYKYYDAENKPISKEAFVKATNAEYIGLDKKSDKLVVRTFKKDNTPTNPLLAVASAFLGGIFASCTPGDDITVNNFSNYNYTTLGLNVTTSSSLVEALAALVEINRDIAKYQQMNTQNTDEIKNIIKNLQGQLSNVLTCLGTIITNQEKKAQSAEEYYQLILDAIGTNGDLLQTVIDTLVKGNTTLNDIKAFLAENNADNEEILKVLSQVKYGVDTLHGDQNEIKTLLAKIQLAMAKLPENIRNEFAPYFESILVQLANGNAELSTINSRLTTLVGIGNAALSKLEELIDLGKTNNNLQTKTNTLINSVLDAIKNLPNYESYLKQIINSIDTNSAQISQQLDDVTELLDLISKKTIPGNENNEKLLGAILEAINKLPNYKNYFEDILDSIDVNTSVNNDGMAELAKLIATINQNVVKGNQQNQKLMGEILAAIKDLDATAAAGFKAVINAIGNKTQQGVDLSRIEATLSQILDAIKNHKVEVTVDVNGHFTCTCPNGNVNEGIIEDLEWILG